MFAEMTKEHVEAAISSELQSAVEKYGEQYNSLHEGYAVLKEEVEETDSENEQLKECLEIFWKNVVKQPDYMRSDDLSKTHIKHIKEHAENLALEACQIAAVCNKILNSI